MKVFVAFACAVAVAAPLSAQTPAVSLRPFFVVSGERFAAQQTFETVFGQPIQPLYGGGLSVVSPKGFFDVTVSRFSKAGQRAFFFERQGFGLGIPLNVTVTALDFTVGGRFRVGRRLVPYVGGGVGSYQYKESGPFDDGPFEKRHAGYLAVGGVELRLGRWVAVSGDAQYTHVTGIIGEGGVSKDAGESDLGGVAGRFRVLIGR